MRLIPLLFLLACGSPGEEPLELTPATASLRPGESLMLAVNGDGASWSSSDPSVVTVAAGRVTAVAPGTATVTATAGTRSATASVTVLSLPAARWGHALVADEARARVVLFGGSAGATFFGDTWLWDGAAWQLAARAGPSARDQHVMAYDPARGRVVLSGGRLAGGAKATDTWEWDGTRWEERVAAGPPAREHAGGGFDRERNRFVVYGGQDPSGTELHDTWEWDGTTWERRATTAPSPGDLPSRGGAWSAPRHHLLLVVARALWEWDGAAWTVVPGAALAAAPPVLLAETGTPGEALALADDGSSSRWDGQSWRAAGTVGGGTRFVSAMALDPTRRQVLLFGGATTGNRYLGDTWVWDGATWSMR